jgi:hypothetical protein
MSKKFVKDPESMLSTAYQKFDQLFLTIDSVPVEEWTITHSLVYICKKYQEKFGMKFVLSYKASPSTSPEYKLTARLWMMLGAKKGHGARVKEYIDWFYHNYNSKTHFVSVGALTREAAVASFQKIVKVREKPSRSTPLPKLVQTIAQAFPDTAYVKTWGDLVFLKESMENDKDCPGSYREMFEAMESNGVDLSVLKEVM